MGHCPRLSMWTLFLSQESLKTDSLPCLQSEKEVRLQIGQRYNTAGFEDGEKGPLAKECGHLLEAGKDKNMDYT